MRQAIWGPKGGGQSVMEVGRREWLGGSGVVEGDEEEKVNST